LKLITAKQHGTGQNNNSPGVALRLTVDDPYTISLTALPCDTDIRDRASSLPSKNRSIRRASSRPLRGDCILVESNQISPLEFAAHKEGVHPLGFNERAEAAP
jgi:hypothetical protein